MTDSGCARDSRIGSGSEGERFETALPVLEAVVKLADHAVEEVALGGGVPVADLAAAPAEGVGSG
ncbi:hypothetical protein ACGFXB_45270 [Streptomyces canus]|uniref:hypothetical protein n=1 Tax=Streptomyces canus TaxID=58343 RepID=UPI0037143677